MLMFNDMTYLDFSGPNDFWARPRNAKISVISKSMDVIRTDTGTKVLPDMVLSQAPDLDLIFVGGGPGVSALMEDAEILEFLQKRAPSARFITSVCTGALVLGAAGLLRGRKATTHWTAMDVLPIFGAEPVQQRVVTDGNLITGGGVTAGIDFGLSVAAQVWGEQTAQLLQLGSEYDPHPPFNAGRPETAPREVVSRLKTITERQTNERIAIAERAAARFR
ncbi:DJ-1/PfpI family protein [Agrobacterium larrymoorei]|nr:DJ-1/PfpI family protein [Agrobacterium larrymoorei]